MPFSRCLNDNTGEATGRVAIFASDLATCAAALLEHCRRHHGWGYGVTIKIGNGGDNILNGTNGSDGGGTDILSIGSAMRGAATEGVIRNPSEVSTGAPSMLAMARR